MTQTERDDELDAAHAVVQEVLAKRRAEVLAKAEEGRADLLAIAAELLAALDTGRLLEVVDGLPTAQTPAAQAARERFGDFGAPMLQAVRKFDDMARTAAKEAKRAAGEPTASPARPLVN